MILFRSKVAVFFLFFFVTFLLQSQSQLFSSSRVYVQTIYHHNACFSFSSDAFLIYDANKQELSFSVDFSTFKVGVDTLDEWLQDLSDAKLKFVAHLPAEQLPTPTNHSSRLFHLSGDLILNNVISKHIVDVIIFTTPDQSMHSRTTGDAQFDKMRAHLSFAFLPKEFGVHKKPHHLKKSISIKVAEGFINYIRQ